MTLTADVVEFGIETVKVIAVVPVLPSVIDAGAIDTAGGASSSTIVPVTLAVPSVAFTAFESATVNVSLPSASRSPATSTENVALVEPAGIVTVPDLAV